MGKVRKPHTGPVNGHYNEWPMTSNSSVNSFGRYLSRLRAARGFSNTNEYLRQYPVPMSSVHYRHLESGNRKVSIDAAKDLCEALQADTKVFYFNLLRDWLPNEFMDFFVSMDCDPVTSDGPADLAEVKQRYQEAVMRTLSAQVLFPSSEACQYLEAHFDLLPLIWFVYSTENASVEGFQAIAHKNNIALPTEKTIDELQRLGLIFVEKQEKMIVISRVKSSISFSHNKLGLRILDYEIQKSLAQYDKSRNPHMRDSILILSVMSASEKTRKIIFKRIQDFVGEVREAADVSSKSKTEDSEPVFYSLVFASRKECAVKPVFDKV